MFRYSIVFLLVGCLVIPTTLLHAVSSSFTARTRIGIDTTPPTTPTGLSAVPITYSQINLSWLPSTDDVELTGYLVRRDGMHIATTTAPAYVDTGLNASTTYTYEVMAYDHVLNISSSSVPVATTTPGIPVPPVVSDSNVSHGSLRPFKDILISLAVLPEKDSVIIRHETNMYTRAVIKWGRTISYELGSLAEQAFTKVHETRIAGLRPDTLYYFTIEGEDQFGREGVMHTGTFKTLAPDDTFPPGNVTNLTGVREGKDIVLSWTLPRDPDLAYVRVVRSDTFYPSDIADGWVVYEGLLDNVRDTDIGEDIPYYYTVFSYDTLGNISSGAVVRVLTKDGLTATTSPIEVMDVTKNTIALSFEDVLFIQEGDILPVLDGSVQIDGSKQLSIALPYSVVPQHLKTILVAIREGEGSDRVFQFLLRINAERTHYVSTLAPFGKSGIFPFSLAVFDYTTSQIGYADGLLISKITTLNYHDQTDKRYFFSYIVSLLTSYMLWFLFLLCVLFFVGYRLVRGRRKEV